MHNANPVCSSQDVPKVGQEKEETEEERMKRGEVLRACAVGMAPVPEQGQCKAPVCMTHTVPVTQWLNQMRSVLVPSSGKVHRRDARRAQPALFPQCQQLRAGVDVWWVTDLTLSSLGGEKQHPHFEPVEQPPAPFTSPQPHNTSVPLSTAPRFSSVGSHRSLQG